MSRRIGHVPLLPNPGKFHVIKDSFESVKDVTNAIKEAGVVKCGLILGIDYTISNRLQGLKTFGGRSLHDIRRPDMNPYQQVIVIIREKLQDLDDDGLIPVYGFGDEDTKDKSVFPLKSEGKCKGFNEVLNVYNERTPNVQLSGSTNFVPLIEKAVKIVRKTGKYHILVIVADGQVTNEKINSDAIVEASKWSLSIVVIGVGYGQWDSMKEFKDNLPPRVFDNFQFVNFHETVTGAKNPYAAFALAVLMEIPEQYQSIKNHELLQNG